MFASPFQSPRLNGGKRLGIPEMQGSGEPDRYKTGGWFNIEAAPTPGGLGEQGGDEEKTQQVDKTSQTKRSSERSAFE
jgi:hypothetical protein